MDIALYGRVLWRFRFVTFLGFVLAIALSFFSFASVSTHGVHYRQPETWQVQSTLLITQKGFTFGRSVLPMAIPPAAANKVETVVPKWGDEGRLSGLALLYSRLATSDTVMRQIRRSGPLHGTVFASPVYTSDASNAGTLPLLQISGYSTTPALAGSLAKRAADAFTAYLRDSQAAARIPDTQRVLVEVVNQPRRPILVAGRKKTVPMLIFVAMISITIGLAFLLENLRPRVREAAHPAGVQGVHSETRRSA